jgi:signal transduction histidine kinase
MISLAGAFPFLAGLAALRGHVLLGRALHPIDEIINAAEIISIKNLSQRLPVAKTGDEFERMSTGLNRMIERLQGAYLALSRFAADASHQLRTPLTIMRGELEALVHEPPKTEELVISLGSILEETARLTRIVEGLLLLSRLEAQDAKTRQAIVDFGELVDSIVEETHVLAGEKNITIVRHLEPKILVEADEFRIRQAIINLLDNAIKYTPDGGTITITVGATEEHAFFTVEDTGIGIPGDEIPLIFQRFYRTESVKSNRIPGSGLGLSIVETIAQSHRVIVTVSSSVGKGSSFRFQLSRYLKTTPS